MELEGRELLCDCVLSATGRSGAVDGLNLEAGLGERCARDTWKIAWATLGEVVLMGSRFHQRYRKQLCLDWLHPSEWDLVTVSFGICVGPGS